MIWEGPRVPEDLDPPRKTKNETRVDAMSTRAETSSTAAATTVTQGNSQTETSENEDRRMTQVRN